MQKTPSVAMVNWQKVSSAEHPNGAMPWAIGTWNSPPRLMRMPA
jgi:hypothetical protein